MNTFPSFLRGCAGAALANAAAGLFIAGMIATVLVTLLAPIVAELAVKLGLPEHFMLPLAVTTVNAVLGKSTLRGRTPLLVGPAACLVGLNQILAQARYTSGMAGPKSANNVTITMAMIPLLMLIIPTSNTTAILLGAFKN